MPDDERSNPFEEFIESDVFDVSQLGHERQQPNWRMHLLLSDLPNLLDNQKWLAQLDSQQQDIAQQLAYELVSRYLRPEYYDELRGWDDHDLQQMAIVIISMAMLAEQRLHHVDPKPESSTANWRSESAWRIRHSQRLTLAPQPEPPKTPPKRLNSWLDSLYQFWGNLKTISSRWFKQKRP